MGFTAGEPVWIELNTNDAEQAETFFTALFGWSFQSTGSEFGGYKIIELDGQSVGGEMQIDPKMMAGVQPGFAIYLATDDIQETTKKVQDAGGQVAVPPMQIADQGWSAFYIDPTGAGVGAWQAGNREGFEAKNTPGGSSWYELMTTDYDKAVAFYRDAFGWDVQPMGNEGGDWQYSTLGSGDNAKAGICDAKPILPAGTGSYWRVYFETTDTDRTVDTIKEMGGDLRDGPDDTDWGRIATVASPEGVTFQLMG